MPSKIAVITMGVKLGYEDKGYTRFLSICQVLCDAGFEVDLITSSFQHWKKEQRDVDNFPYDMYDFNVVFIDEPGYKRNIDLRRIKSHSVAAKNLKKYLDSASGYDLVYAEVPPNDVALVAAEYAEARNIPFISDINDLWPEAMRMVFDVPVLSSLMFSGLSHDAEQVYSRVSGIVGTSDEYALRPYTNCSKDVPHITVYVGNDIDLFDEGVALHSDEICKPKDEFWVIYTGTLGKSYDIKTLIEASTVLKDAGHANICIKILGSGPDEEKLKEQATLCNCNVDFLGYMDYQTMAAYLSKSDVAINSLVKKAPQSIVTKIGDYLAAGIPMINTGESIEFKNKVTCDGFGINISAQDPYALAQCILALADDKELCSNMGKIARKIAEEQFDRKRSYQKIVEFIKSFL